MDKLTWFKFTPSDWMMGKIQRCSVETRGMFMNLCCLYWNKECDLSVEDAEIEVDEKPFKEMVKKKVVLIDGDNIRISFLDEQMEEILETSEKRRDAANKRWAKKNAKAMQVHASALQNDADKSKSKSKKREELEKSKEEYTVGSSNEQPQPPKRQRKVFKPPTLQEVSTYCQERNNTVNAQQWIDHYTSNGWMVGKNKMKDWKAAVRTWERNNINNEKNGFGKDTSRGAQSTRIGIQDYD